MAYAFNENLPFVISELSKTAGFYLRNGLKNSHK